MLIDQRGADMQYEKKELIAEGKTKRVWATQNDRLVIVEFKDDALNYHGKKHVFFHGKGALSNQINAYLQKLLEENGIPTHFKCKYSDTESVMHLAEMIPVEVVVRNYTAGTMCQRLGLPECMRLKAPVLEFCYKSDELGDPVINEYHAYAMGLCTREELANMCYTVSRINKVLVDTMKKIGIVVADFKVEFGRINGRLVVADELTPTVSRMWNAETLSKFDTDGTNPALDYEIVLQRLTDLLGKDYGTVKS